MFGRQMSENGPYLAPIGGVPLGARRLAAGAHFGQRRRRR